jgi:hypothetical protein
VEKNEFEFKQDLSQEEKIEAIKSWFDKYEIKMIVIKRPDVVIHLNDN